MARDLSPCSERRESQGCSLTYGNVDRFGYSSFRGNSRAQDCLYVMTLRLLPDLMWAIPALPLPGWVCIFGSTAAIMNSYTTFGGSDEFSLSMVV